MIDGIRFDSQAESRRYLFLKQQLDEGLISGLVHHKSFSIVVNGLKICTYESDFVYIKKGVRIVEDVKSKYTAKLSAWRMKKKLMKALFGIDVIEVFA